MKFNFFGTKTIVTKGFVLNYLIISVALCLISKGAVNPLGLFAALSLPVFIHELGHYSAARWLKYVPEEMAFNVNGAYVRIPDAVKNKDYFGLGLIAFTGPMANFFFGAIGLLISVFMGGAHLFGLFTLINCIYFVGNLLVFPGTDGCHVVFGLLNALKFETNRIYRLLGVCEKICMLSLIAGGVITAYHWRSISGYVFAFAMFYIAIMGYFKKQ